MAVQEININEIIDFSWCPLYYDFKHKDNNKNVKQAYDEALHHCFYHYLRSLQNDGYIANTLELLKRKWGKEWIKQKRNSEIALTPSAAKNDSYERRRKSGIDGIITFDKLMRQEQFPIAVNLPYELELPRGIKVKGVWEYIREINGELQILKFRTEDSRWYTSHWAEHDIELTAAQLAFNQTFNKKDPTLVYVDLYTKKLIHSKRGSQDQKMFINTVYSTVQCLKHNIRCITPDKRCWHCEYRRQCMK